MSTQEASPGESTDRKALTLLHTDQLEAYQNAKRAVEAERGEELSSGGVVKELARAYTGWPG